MPYRVYRECNIFGGKEWLETEDKLTHAEADLLVLKFRVLNKFDNFKYWVEKEK